MSRHLELGRTARAGDTHLELMSVQMGLRVMVSEEVTQAGDLEHSDRCWGEEKETKEEAEKEKAVRLAENQENVLVKKAF